MEGLLSTNLGMKVGSDIRNMIFVYVRRKGLKHACNKNPKKGGLERIPSNIFQFVDAMNNNE